MARLKAVRTFAMALVWMPLYLFVFAPLIFVIVLVFSTLRFLYALATGKPFRLKPDAAIRVYDWAEDNTLASLGAEDRDFSWSPPMGR